MADTQNQEVLTLQKLVGRLTTRALEDRAALSELQVRLRTFYMEGMQENWSPERRMEYAREFRKTMETAKLISESLFQTAMQITSGDM